MPRLSRLATLRSRVGDCSVIGMPDTLATMLKTSKAVGRTHSTTSETQFTLTDRRDRRLSRRTHGRVGRSLTLGAGFQTDSQQELTDPLR